MPLVTFDPTGTTNPTGGVPPKAVQIPVEDPTLADWLNGDFQKIYRSLEVKFGWLAAQTISGTVVAILDSLMAGSEVTGSLLGRLDAHYQNGKIEALKAVRPGTLDPREVISGVFRRFVSTGEYLEEAARSGYSERRANILLSLSTPPLSEPTIISLLRRNKLSEGDAKLFIRDLGYGESDATLQATLAYEFLSVGELVTAWLREDISEGSLNELLRELGLQEREQTIIKKLAFFIPPIPDLVRFAVREAFSPEQVQKLSLDAEFPTDFETWSKRQGVSSDWAHKYWRAHWELPSITQAFEMFHRTTYGKIDDGADQLGTADGKPYYNVIGKSTLDALLKAQDVAPVWRDKLTAISYNPLTRVDIRRMYSLGVIDRDQVKKAYFDEGYNAENAELITRFVEIDAADDFVANVRTRAYKAFRDGILSEAEFRAYLIQLKTPPELIDKIVNAQKLQHQIEREERITKATQARYMKRTLSSAEALTRLLAMGYDGEKAAYLIGVWTDEREAKISRISVRDLSEAFSQQLIPESRYRQELEERNFPADDIDILVLLKGKTTSEANPEF